MSDENWKLTPYPHQWASYLENRDKLNHALWHDQGLGKTALCLAIAAHLYRKGEINAVLVLAPPGVESNWIFDELPKHLTVRHLGFSWSSDKSKTKRGMAAYESFLVVRHQLGDPLPDLKVLAMSYNAIMTDRGAKAARKFLDDHDVLYIADETTVIKSPDAKITKRIVASAKYAKYRRALNGTPVEDSPFALYTQAKFVDPNCWTRRGINTYGQFKVFFGEFITHQLGNGKSFPELVAYRNMDILHEVLHEVGERLLKEDHLDLPPKVYTKRYYELTPKQVKLYKDLTDFYTTELANGETIDAELAIVRLTRFQQICSGYFPREEDSNELIEIDANNPRIKLLGNVLDDVHRQAIIWAKYNADIDAIAALLTKRKESFVVYDGRTSADERQNAKRYFQAGTARFFVAKPQAAGRGLTLTAAEDVIYYNNNFSADLRKQSEDRCILEGQPILTPTGWTPVEDILVGDKVIGKDGLPHRIIDTWSRKAKGVDTESSKDICEIKVRGWHSPIKVTSDHLMLTTRGWVGAKYLRPRDRLKMPDRTWGQNRNIPVTRRVSDTHVLTARQLFGGFYQEPRRMGAATGVNTLAIHLPEFIAINETSAFIMGFYIGDGFSSTSPDKGRFVSLAGHQNKDQETHDMAAQWARSMGINSTTQSDPAGLGMEMRMYSSELSWWFEGNFGRTLKTKYVPEWMFKSGELVRVAFLKGWVAADGYVRKNRHEIITASNRLCADVTRLLMSVGEKPCPNWGESAGAWTIGWTPGQPQDLVVTSVLHRTCSNEERIYDLTVEDAESFVVGTSVVHNCHRIGQTKTVRYIDLIATGTVDEHILSVLRNKRKVSAIVTGDDLLSWT